MTQTASTTVLLIEDSPSDVRLIEEQLHQSAVDSFTLLTAPTLSKGLELLSRNSVDVVLLDLGLPDSQGLATFRALYAHTPHLPIIVLTVSDDEALGEQILREGAQRFLSKDALTLGVPYARIFTRMIRFAIRQKQAEAALVESEQRYRSIAETANIIILRSDLQLIISYCNDYTLKLLGYTAEEFIGKPVVGTLLPPIESTGRDLAEMARDILQHPEEYTHNRNEVMTKDGRRLVIEWTNAPQFDRDGTYSGVLATGIDVTERVKAEDALQESHEEVQTLNEELQTTTEELRVTNEELEQRVAERTAELSEAAAWLKEEVVARREAEATITRRAHELEVINEIITIGSTAHDLSSLLSQLLTKTLDFTDFEVGHVRLLHDGVLTLECSLGLPSYYIEEEGETPVTDPLYASILHTGKPRFEEFFDRAFPARARDSALQTAGAVPLLAGRDVIGVIGVGSQQRRRLSTEQKELLALIGREAGTVIARLQAEAAAHTHAQHTVLLNNIIQRGNTTTDAQDFLQYVCDLLVKERGYDAVDVRVITDEHDIAEQIAVTGFPVEFNEQFRFMSIDDPVLRGVYRGEPYFPSRHAKTHVDLVHATHMASVGIVPLGVGGTIIGDMGVALKHYRPFTQDEQALLISIGRETGTVVARLQAEGQVRAGARYTRSLIEASLDPLVTISAEGIITDVNKATEEVTGYSRDELVGSDFSDYFTEPEQARAGYKRVFTDGFVRDYPLGIRHRSGSVIDVLYNAVVYRTEAGAIQGVFAAARDVTEQTRAEKALKESETRYRSLVERNFDGVIIHSDGIIRYANDAAARISRVSSPDELIGTSAFELSTPAYRELLKQRVQEIYRTHKSSDLIEIQANTRDGTAVDIELSGAFITYEGTPAIYVVARDISERKQMEARLKQYADHLEDLVEERTAQLKDAERLAAIGQTATMIGHDLRNPLQALQLSVDLAQKFYNELSPEQKVGFDAATADRIFSGVEKQIQYMDKIVSDLQDYSRPLTLEPKEVELGAFVSDTLGLLTIPESVSVDVNVTGALTAAIDPHLMQRVLSNLIMNAVQAMPTGGELKLSAAAEDHAVVIRIHDTGDGVPEDMRDKLFSPLTTGKAKGTGLGLAVVKRIVEAHNGTITFENEEGKGTTFIMTLPQTAQ